MSKKDKNGQKEEKQVDDDTISMKPIGHVSSVYRLCVGTPRQGLLAPSSRGRIDLYPNRIAPDSILELEKFSHIWVVFIFHLNSNAKTMEESK
jgi:tRNA (Thr-GGU) A37 N-methylase